MKPGETVRWSFGDAKGTVKADAEELVTVPGLKITGNRVTLILSK